MPSHPTPNHQSPTTSATGPTTPEGKAISARNSLRHGLRARAIVLPDESQDDWESFEQAYLEDLAPLGIAEETLALRAAELLWRMRRVASAERDAVYERQEHPENYVALNRRPSSLSPYRPPTEMPEMLPESLPAPAALRPIMRYEAHLSRQFFQVTRELQLMQDRRQGRTTRITRVEIHGYPNKSETSPASQEGGRPSLQTSTGPARQHKLRKALTRQKCRTNSDPQAQIRHQPDCQPDQQPTLST